MPFLIKSIVMVQFLCMIFPLDYVEHMVTNRIAVNTHSVSARQRDPVLGVWEYEIKETDSYYGEGVFFITKEQGKYSVAIHFSNGALTGQEVTVKGNQINFNMNVSGLERISFVLMMEENMMLGESFSANESNPVKGIRKQPIK